LYPSQESDAKLGGLISAPPILLVDIADLTVFRNQSWPTETGNQVIKDGSLHKSFQATMSKLLKPEAAYFVAEHGQ